MKPSLLAFLLLFFLILSEAQGIRLKNGFLTVEQQRIHGEKGSVTKTSNGGLGEVILCKDGHCSGKYRKLIMTKTTSTSTTTTTTTTTASKNEKNEGNKADPTMSKTKSSNGGLSREEENFPVDKSPVSNQRDVVPEHYPDIIDIAGMDYSPARRKPPIHN